jgi:hypothetical protein
MNVCAMRSDQGRQRGCSALSDKTASCGALATACCVLALAATLPAGAAVATRDGDPLHSPECALARAELDAALAAPQARHSARLQQAREQALHACLGNATGARRRSGAPEPSQVVRPTLAAPPAGPPRDVLPTAAPGGAPPAVEVPRAAMITNCEPGGCWDSQGRRFNRAGPLLIGPGGCLAQGGLVTCP